MRAAYTGNEALTFSEYIDLGTGKTLRAEPGGTYDIIPASGRVVAEIPAPWFVPAMTGAGRRDLRPGERRGRAEPGPSRNPQRASL